MVANMDDPWVQACGYQGMVLMGAGSICDRALPWQAIQRYLAVHPFDEEFQLEADFAVGVLVPGEKVDLGYTAREFSDDADRLYQQPGQTERKWKVIRQAEALK
jgi:hypothetical protein